MLHYILNLKSKDFSFELMEALVECRPLGATKLTGKNKNIIGTSSSSFFMPKHLDGTCLNCNVLIKDLKIFNTKENINSTSIDAQKPTQNAKMEYQASFFQQNCSTLQ